ncbi:MAG: TrmB family transcriptional regulator [Candidatus Magasanikbacteria bacterium]|nr:TrmB family transcriptional regulator [Candidatus Magasanikbacteria bacterium]
MDINFLKKLGFSDKSAKVYLALLRLGPSSVRKLAENCELNRGSTYDSLKWLQDKGVVNFYKQDSKQHFVVEDPLRLKSIIVNKKKKLSEVDSEMDRIIPELQAIHHKGGDRPMARYYNHNEIKEILEDVLENCEHSEEKEYRIYSAEGVRQYLYEDFPTFSDARIGKGISVKVIALGEGGNLRGLDKRKWIKDKSETPTYIIIYPNKTAYISLNAKREPVGVVIENKGVYETQRAIFEELWTKI